MTHTSLHVALVALVVVGAGSAPSAQHPAMPAGMTHEEHQAQMKKDAEMSGGAIEVGVNAAADIAGRDAIRAHLKEIAADFAKGNFEKPFMTHAEAPAGVETMKQLVGRIRYSFKQTAGGGMVRIETNDTAARDAVHRFLRYQITEHATGDPLTVQR